MDLVTTPPKNNALNLFLVILIVFICLLLIVQSQFLRAMILTETQVFHIAEEAIEKHEEGFRPSRFSYREDLDSIYLDYHFNDVHLIRLITYWADTIDTLVKGSNSHYAVDKFQFYEVLIIRYNDKQLRFYRIERFGENPHIRLNDSLPDLEADSCYQSLKIDQNNRKRIKTGPMPEGPQPGQNAPFNYKRFAILLNFLSFDNGYGENTIPFYGLRKCLPNWSFRTTNPANGQINTNKDSRFEPSLLAQMSSFYLKKSS